MYSVLMPAQNAQRTVGLAIRSTLRALPESAELLVLDDASSDETPRVVEDIAREDKRVRLERSVQPVGVSAGLNALLSLARQPYVARMDADDVTFSWRFAHQTKALESGADVVFSTRVNFGSRPASFRPAPLSKLSADEMPYQLMIGNPVPHSSMAMHRAVLTNAGGYANSPAEDYELWLRLAAESHNMVRLGKPVLAYRMHAGQVTKSAEWRSRYTRDTSLDSAHTALAMRLGWSGGSVWSAMARRTLGDATLEDRAELTTFVDFVRDVSTRLPRKAKKKLVSASSRLL